MPKEPSTKTKSTRSKSQQTTSHIGTENVTNNSIATPATIPTEDSPIKLSSNNSQSIDYFGFFLVAIVIAITVLTAPDLVINQKVTINQVWYFGWITAVSTGLGVIPFFFISEPNKFWMGISNGVAGGMMIAASYSLAYEGASFVDDDDVVSHSFYRTLAGIGLGMVFIIITKQVLDKYEDLKFDHQVMVDRTSAQRMILIVFVMTLHSLTEGVGIGVSFGGQRGMQLGQFISLSLAVHNIPEGLAVALVMTSRKVSRLRAGLWAIFTSLPQPIMAIPAFIFVERFEPLMPIGLGFAAGAMAYVAVFELLVEAIEDTSILATAVTGTLACGAMMVAQELVKNAV